MASGKNSNPLYGHFHCLSHASRFQPHRIELKFFWIGPEHLPDSLLCGPCARKKRKVHGGLCDLLYKPGTGTGPLHGKRRF